MRLTQQLFMVEVLSRKSVPSDLQILSMLEKQFPGCTPDLSWYLSRFRTGSLQGQNGTPQKINRKNLPVERRKRAAPRMQNSKRSATNK